MAPTKKKLTTTAVVKRIATSDVVSNGKDQSAAKLSASKDQAQAVREDLLWKLPPELRNRVYKHAYFLRRAPRVLQIHYGRWRPDSQYDPNPIFLRWEEPSLLRAAKWIRQEVKLLYFSPPRIDIALSTSEFQLACDWLRTIVAGDSEDRVKRVTLRVRSAHWQDMHSWLPLAQFVRDFNLDHSFLAATELKAASTIWRFSDNMYWKHKRIDDALHQVIGLGISARKDGWSDTELEMNYEDWMETLLGSNKVVASASDRRKLECGFSDKHRSLIAAGGGVAENEALADKYRYRGSKVEYRGQLQMTLRKRPALVGTDSD
ncbi:hypothetical protein LTS12_012494 [Elasticomyces elasticus]|nr:hypothetical protein LTS12_012494 [Elasticomyces elasticus]